MAGSLVKEVLVKITTDDADAEEKLDRISAKADELRAKHPELTVKVDTAEASAKLLVFREELKAMTKSATVDVDAKAGKGGLLSRLLYGSSGGGGLMNTGLEGGAGAGAAIPDAALMWGGVAAAIGPVIVELTGVVAGLAAAGAGVGALALVALPTFEKVKTALADTPAELKKQPALIQQIVGQVDQLKKSFDKIGQSMMPQLLGIFNQGLGIAAQLMPVIAKFAQAAAPAVSEVMTALSKSIDSKGFKDFADKFSKISGPSIEAIGQGFGKVAAAVGKLLTVMSAHDVVHALNIAFDILAGTINLLTGWVSRLMSNWDQLSAHAQTVAHTVVSNWNTMVSFFEGLPASFGQIIRNIENWWDTFVSFVKQIPGKIVAALGNLGSLLVHAGESIIDGLLSGLESSWHKVTSFVSGIGSWIAAHKGPLSADATLLTPHGNAIITGLAAGMQQAMPVLESQLARTTAAISGLGGTGLAGGGTGGQLGIQLSLAGGTGNQFETLLLQSLRAVVRRTGGGGGNSVQRALGQTS